MQGYSQTQFFYGAVEGVFYDPTFTPYIDRDLAVATRTVRGGTAFGIYPFNRYRRVELYGGMVNYNEQYDNEGLQELSDDYQEEQFGRTLFNNGNMMPLGVTFVQETTVFREFGPLAGSTVRVNYEAAPKIGSFLSRQTIDVDARKYLRLGGSGLLALRAKGFHSWGQSPSFLYFGGNSEMRGYDYLSFVGQDAFFTERRTALPADRGDGDAGRHSGRHSRDAVRQPGRRELGQSGLQSVDHQFLDRNADHWHPNRRATRSIPIYGVPREISGFRLLDARGSYGISMQTFALGFPIHFDWSWKTLFSREWEDVVYSPAGWQRRIPQGEVHDVDRLRFLTLVSCQLASCQFKGQ